MRPRRVVVVGDVVLDRDVDGAVDRLCPDAPVPVVDVRVVRESPGGAGLTALLCAGSGVDVTLVAPIGSDAAGQGLASALRGRVHLVGLLHEGPTRRKTRVRSAGQSLLRLDDGGPGRPLDPPLDEVREVLAGADVVLVSDYGAGTTADVGLRRLLSECAARGATLVWDPHPRGAPPVEGTALVTPNLGEARTAARAAGLADDGTPDALAEALRERWRARAVCVTAGSQGAWLALSGSEPMYVPAPPVTGGDPCGAGDRFAASAATGLARGAVLSEAVLGAVADASAWVASGGAESYRAARLTQATQVVVDGAADRTTAHVGGDAGPGPSTAADVVARVRAGGGTVVATGGCFDVLHAGHVAYLTAARRLGDALVVLVNSDDSVRRLKGPGRPAVPEQDRVRVLAALGCVDGVSVFVEDDPRQALERLRPDVWAKGGDYGGARMPEAEAVRGWGGRVVLLPYVDGRSTTSILARAASQLPADQLPGGQDQHHEQPRSTHQHHDQEVP